jgi:hypothetical protein
MGSDGAGQTVSQTLSLATNQLYSFSYSVCTSKWSEQRTRYVFSSERRQLLSALKADLGRLDGNLWVCSRRRPRFLVLTFAFTGQGAHAADVVAVTAVPEPST